MRARQASVEAMGAPLDAIAAQEDVRGFFAPQLPHIPGRLLCQTVSSSVKAQPMNRPYVKLYTSIGIISRGLPQISSANAHKGLVPSTGGTRTPACSRQIEQLAQT